jgi:heme-binding protein
MSPKKKIVSGITLVLLAIQLIRPARNTGEADTPQDITHAVEVPADIKNILVTSCYDCHSNHTNHMWYENVQPIGWWIGHHIKEGKQKLNFSEFAGYSLKRQKHKLEEVAEIVGGHEMPMSSYLIIHKNAALLAGQEQALMRWAKACSDSIRVK